MGWNDRLPEDPYTPPESFYRDRDDYEAWLEYVEMQLDKEEAGLSSQNIDPADLQTQSPQETPSRQHSFAARIWARIFGQNIPENKNEKSRQENVDAPF